MEQGVSRRGVAKKATDFSVCKTCFHYSHWDVSAVLLTVKAPTQRTNDFLSSLLCPRDYLISSWEPFCSAFIFTSNIWMEINFTSFYFRYPLTFRCSDKIKKRYGNLGMVLCHTIDRGANANIGISLAGHRDRNKMACFIAGINPKGIASSTGGLEIGDEILEVNCNHLHRGDSQMARIYRFESWNFNYSSLCS